MSTRIHPTAIIEQDVEIGPGSAIWDNVHVRHGTEIGQQCIVGGKTYIAYDCVIGHFCKINASVYICTGVTIEDGVMISAGTIFTNDRFPRAASVALDALLPSEPDDTTEKTLVRCGATIGAGCIIGSNLTIGCWAMIGMGSVVTRSIPDFHLVVGHPAKSIGAVCRCGNRICTFNDSDIREKLHEENGGELLTCSACGLRYHRQHQTISELTPDG